MNGWRNTCTKSVPWDRKANQWHRLITINDRELRNFCHFAIVMYRISGSGSSWPDIRPFFKSGFGSGSGQNCIRYRISQPHSSRSFWHILHQANRRSALPQESSLNIEHDWQQNGMFTFTHTQMILSYIWTASLLKLVQLLLPWNCVLLILVNGWLPTGWNWTQIKLNFYGQVQALDWNH